MNSSWKFFAYVRMDEPGRRENRGEREREKESSKCNFIVDNKRDRSFVFSRFLSLNPVAIKSFAKGEWIAAISPVARPRNRKQNRSAPHGSQ